VEAVFFCGTRSGRLHDKTKESGFKTLPAGKVNPPLIVGACANFECQVTAAVQTGSHTLFVGKIVASHMDAQAGDRLFATSDGQFAGFAKS